MIKDTHYNPKPKTFLILKQTKKIRAQNHGYLFSIKVKQCIVYFWKNLKRNYHASTTRIQGIYYVSSNTLQKPPSGLSYIELRVLMNNKSFLIKSFVWTNRLFKCLFLFTLDHIICTLIRVESYELSSLNIFSKEFLNISYTYPMERTFSQENL